MSQLLSWLKSVCFPHKSFAPLPKVPKHLAIIMDGNGRWAQHRGLPISVGHSQGAKTLKNLVQAILDHNLPIESLTVYAFSTENWQRPPEEVNYIVQLFSQYLEGDLQKMQQQNIRINILGDRNDSHISEDLRQKINHLEEKSRQNSRFTLNIAFNYGGRSEITHAMQEIATDIQQSNITPEAIDTNLIAQHMYLPELNDLDLVIRTGKQKRISNFLLWQLAYAEFSFSDILWPDFTFQDLYNILRDFGKQERRFGKRS